MRWAIALALCAGIAAAGERELGHEEGRKAGHKSRAGTGHVISFDAPRGKWWIRSVSIFGARYGGGYDPATTKFAVTVCDDDLKPLTSTEGSYEVFAQGGFGWVEVPLVEPVVVPRHLKVVVEFRPTATKGVYVGYAATEDSHSGWGVPGGREQPFDGDKEWMIRVQLSTRKPEPPKEKEPSRAGRARYLEDFDFLARTVRSRFPALRKKGVDWSDVCRAWKPRFAAAEDDRAHILNAHQLLAILGDMHTGITDSTPEVHVPSFDGLYGAGLWIAADRGRLLLRAATEGHPILDRVRPGAELLRLDGKPARLVHLGVRTRLKQWHGWSSDHFLDARLSFQFFPFGDAERIRAEFLDPGGEVVEVDLPRWGPGGKGLSRAAATMPEGVAAEGNAVSTRLDDRVGYVRILGGMDERTREAFFAALDGLKGVEGVLLDCRGMGGGGDGPAWAMAGRFFPKRTPQGSAPALEPTGAWQFAGPVVLLQDERMISSAETFTWAMTETGRALSVGRPTGGATIIPTSFEAPSGLFRFRMGVTDRKTPIRGVQPEGVGTAPDVFVPYEPALLREYGDPVLHRAREALDLLLAGRSRDEIVELLSQPRADEEIAWQLRLLEEPRNPMPDFVGGCARLAELAPLAESAELAARAREATAKWEKEAAAQRACEELLGEGVPPDPGHLKKLLGRHEGTRWVEALR